MIFVYLHLQTFKKFLLADDPSIVKPNVGSKRQNSIRESKEKTNKRKNQKETNESIEDFQLDLPDLELERYSKDDAEQLIDKDNTDAIEFVDEETLHYVERNMNTSDKRGHKRKTAKSEDAEVEEKKKSKKAIRDDEHSITKEIVENSKGSKGRKRSKTYQSDEDIDDLDEAYRAPPKRTTFITTNKGNWTCELIVHTIVAEFQREFSDKLVKV